MTLKNKIWHFALNKPYGVLSQFSDQSNRKTLKDQFIFPKGVYPVGRLDMDSEGLLILTNDKKLTGHLLSPKHHHEKEYYVQIENIPTESELNNLRDGVVIEDRKTLPARVKLIKPPNFDERIPPIRKRENIPTTWLSMIIIEGRNRQVRKMTAKVGHPTLRLLRVRIKNILIGKLKPGEVRELSEKEIRELYM